MHVFTPFITRAPYPYPRQSNATLGYPIHNPTPHSVPRYPMPCWTLLALWFLHWACNLITPKTLRHSRLEPFLPLLPPYCCPTMHISQAVPYPVSCIRHAAYPSFLRMQSTRMPKGFLSFSLAENSHDKRIANFHIICIEVQADSYLRVSEYFWLTNPMKSVWERTEITVRRVAVFAGKVKSLLRKYGILCGLAWLFAALRDLYNY